MTVSPFGDLGPARLASTPSHRWAWLGIAIGNRPVGFPEFERSAPPRLREGRQSDYQGSALPLSYGGTGAGYGTGPESLQGDGLGPAIGPGLDPAAASRHLRVAMSEKFRDGKLKSQQEAEDRFARRAAALRENLRRRKEQLRARSAANKTKSDPDPPTTR